MKVKYFASLRQKRGLAEEEIDFPHQVQTARQAVEYLLSRDEVYAGVFANMQCLCLAVDLELSSLDTTICNADELAFFPPITGG